jgi:hypothetical protein
MGLGAIVAPGRLAATAWQPSHTDHENFNDPVIFDGFLRSALVKLSLTKSHQS